jgi:hypothetical protein
MYIDPKEFQENIFNSPKPPLGGYFGGYMSVSQENQMERYIKNYII